MQLTARLFLVLAFPLFLVSCRSDAPATRAPKAWTYLFYVAGDEDEIDRYSRVPIRKLEQLGSDANRWIVAHTDFHFDETGKHPISEPARRYEVGRFPGPVDANDFATLKIQSREVWHSAGETDSGSGASLREFLQWATKEYPAEHYAVFILGHSWGWRGFGQDFNPGFDLTPVPAPAPSVEFTMMTPGEVRDALRDGMPGARPVDLLVMDACNTATLEVAYAMRDRAKIWVTAATEMPFMSFDYAGSLARLTDAREVAKTMVGEALQSFGRGGSQVRQEGDHPGAAIMAVDLDKLAPLWPLWRELVAELPRSNFRSLFFGGRHERWQDLALNVDLVELLSEIATKSDSTAARATAEKILALLGEPGSRPAIDSLWRELDPMGATSARFTFQGDELPPAGKSVEKAIESFDHLNPHLIEMNKTWKLAADEPGRRVTETSFAVPRGLPFRFRPFIGGAGWVDVDLIKDGAVVNHERYQSSSTVYIRDDYSANSPYLISGHTFGAGRNAGLSVLFDPTVDPERSENYHYYPTEGRWVGGKDYYRTLEFAKDLGWASLILGP